MSQQHCHLQTVQKYFPNSISFHLTQLCYREVEERQLDQLKSTDFKIQYDKFYKEILIPQ
jgi:hypothetical protein